MPTVGESLWSALSDALCRVALIVRLLQSMFFRELGRNMLSVLHRKVKMSIVTIIPEAKSFILCTFPSLAANRNSFSIRKTTLVSKTKTALLTSIFLTGCAEYSDIEKRIYIDCKKSIDSSEKIQFYLSGDTSYYKKYKEDVCMARLKLYMEGYEIDYTSNDEDIIYYIKGIEKNKSMYTTLKDKIKAERAQEIK